MTSVFYRYPASALPEAVRGEGVYLFDRNGKRYLDASGGAAVSILGHGHARVLRAVHEQIDRLAYAHTYFFTSEPAERLAAMLVEQAPGGIERVYFLSGGSEANEAALKLARQYHVDRGQPERTLFIHRRQSYHGNTLGALSVSGNPKRRALYEPLLPASSAVAPCYAYRHQEPGESELAYGERAAQTLEDEILRAGPQRVAAFIAEPVVGATLGAVPAVEGYFTRIREICDRYDVLLILDEVMCGMGRTGTLFASAAEGVVPDMITVAKGLAAGYQPIGAVLVHRDVYEAIVSKHGHFVHGHTYSGHPTACAAALAVQETLRDEELLAQVQPLGASVIAALARAFAEHPHVGDIRGKGLLIGIELVADRESKQPLDPQRGIAAAIKHAGMARGLICYPGSGTVDGVAGDHILLAPPYVFRPEHIDELVTKLSGTLADVLAR